MRTKALKIIQSAQRKRQEPQGKKPTLNITHRSYRAPSARLGSLGHLILRWNFQGTEAPN